MLTIENRVTAFLGNLAQLGDDAERKAALWTAELQDLLRVYEPSTAASYVTRFYRQALSERLPPSSIEATSFFFPRHIAEALGDYGDLLRNAKLRALQPFSDRLAEELVAWAEDTVQAATDRRELLVALGLLTGRRAVELAHTLRIYVKGRRLMAEGYAKKRGNSGEAPLHLLGSTPKAVLEAIGRLRDALKLDEDATATKVNQRISYLCDRGTVARVTGFAGLSGLTHHDCRDIWLAVHDYREPEATRRTSRRSRIVRLLNLSKQSTEAAEAYMTIELVPDEQAPFSCEAVRSGQVDAAAVAAPFKKRELEGQDLLMAQRAKIGITALVQDYLAHGLIRDRSEAQEIGDKALLDGAGMVSVVAPEPAPEPEPVPAPEPVATRRKTKPAATIVKAKVKKQPAPPALGFPERAERVVTLPKELVDRLTAVAAQRKVEIEELLTMLVDSVDKPLPAPEPSQERLTGRELVGATIDAIMAWNQAQSRAKHRLFIGEASLKAITGSFHHAVVAVLKSRADEIAQHHDAMDIVSKTHNAVAVHPQDGSSLMSFFKEHIGMTLKKAAG